MDVVDNHVHPYHRTEHFDEYRHFVLAFHDTTFECVATGYTHELASGPLDELACWGHGPRRGNGMRLESV